MTTETEPQAAPAASTPAEETPQPTYVTYDQFKKGLDEAVAQIRGELPRLQQRVYDGTISKVRKDLGIDTLHQRAREQDIEKELAKIPEETRHLVAPLYRKIADLESALQTAGTQQTTNPVRDYIQNLGIDPDTPGIDYDQFPEKPTAASLAKFTLHVQQAAVKAAAPPAEPAKPQPQRTETPRTPSPPVNAGPPRSAVYQTKEQLLDAAARGEIDSSTLLEKWKVVTGKTWPQGL